MLTELLLAASVLAAGTALEKDAAAEYENVVHPGRDDGTGFWNEKATWFMYAPAFPFKSVPGAVRYRFTVTDTKGGRNVFTAEKPTAALSPVWSKVNVADVTVVCEGVDAAGKAVGTAGERSFWKAAGFVPGKYPLPDRDLREAARRVYAYVFNKPATQHLLDTGKFDPKDPINSYAAKNGSALIRAMLTYAKFDPARRDRALLVAEKAADYLASISSPAGTPLEYLVPTYAGPGESETGLKNADRTMLSEPALIPPCFLDLFHATGKAKYRELAVRMGETLLRLQGDDGTWHLKVFLKDAQPCDPNRLLPIGMIDTLERLYAETGRAEFRTAADRAFDYVCRTRMDNWNWEGQFEDTPPSAPYQNLTKHPACSLAIYLGRRFPGDKARIAQMRELLRFAEDQFVCWERPCDGGPVRGSWGWRPAKSYSKWLTPCALEQYSCYWPIDASAAKLIRAYCALYRAEGHAIDLEKAKALAASVLKVQRADGSVPTWWFDWDGTRCKGGNDWQNCMVASAEALAELAEAADGTSDAERNDSAEMNAAKDVAAARRVEGGVRVLFLGNSITLHSPLESVGWTNRWGMAASCPENDFVHIVTRGIERETGRSADVRVRNVADFERDFKAWRPGPEIRELVDFDAQYVVFAFGENVPDLKTDAERIAWREAVKRFFSLFAHGRAKPHAVVRGVFWPSDWKDACLAHAASDLAFTFVRADFGNSRGMDATGLFWHPGVARHPSDAGMAAIAAAILDGFFPKDSGYEAWVDGKPVDVRPIRVSRQPFNQWAPGYQRPVDQTEVAGMLRFETEGACRLRVRQTRSRGVLRPATNVVIRPLSAGVKPTVDGSGDISFDLPKPGSYVLEIDGYHRPLEIFAQPKRDFAAERREANVVFGPGVHEPVVVKLKSHDRVYIDRDAVVYGSFQADGVEDVKVFGYGIISGARNRRDGNACYREGMDGAVRIIDSRRVTFDGPTVLDSCCWCVSAFNSSDLELTNLKVTGAWRYNTDGIDICNSRRVLVRDCYVHSFDDTLVVKGISHDYVAAKKVLSLGFPRHEAVEDVRFSGCVCWCGWGRTLEVGLETWAERFRGIVFEDCDLIHNNGGALSVHLGGPAVVEDATFRNIRIECDGSEERAVLQTNREQNVTCPKGNACPWLLVTNGKMFARGGLYGSTYDFSKEPHGTVRRLTVEDVSILRTNGAPRPGLGAKAEPGTSFGSLSLSGVTLDGAPFEPTEGERENLRKSFSSMTAFGERADGRLVRFGEAYRNHLVAMETKPLTDVFAKHEETSRWQTEFWGKYMHSAVPLLKRFPNAELERHVRDSSKAVMDAQLPDGYIGNYREDCRAGEGWDVWGVKYTLMGLLHCHDFTREERPLACARRLADWLIREVGPGGKRRIVRTGNYCGMASCSVLEPIIWLYRVTGERRYLDFADEIVREVGYDEDGPRLVTQALKGVPVAERGPWKGKWWRDCKTNAMKAYEMMSCYQGMLDYAEEKVKVEGEGEQWNDLRLAAIRTAEDILEHEINVIGGAGSVEFWYGGAAKQTHDHAHESETCVTITWMRLCERLYRLTDDPKWLAAFRRTFFNVYLGALSPDASRFASYPSLNGKRTYFRSHCGMPTDCCNQNGMRGFVSALNLGVIAGATPDEVRAVTDPHGDWRRIERDGHVAFLCGELVMTFVGDESALPLDLDGFDLSNERDRARLVPFALAGRGLYRTWMEIERHPWDGKLGR